MYLEWLVSADFESVNIPAKERAMDTKKKLLSYGNDRSPLRALLIEPSKVRFVYRSTIVGKSLDKLRFKHLNAQIFSTMKTAFRDLL